MTRPILEVQTANGTKAVAASGRATTINVFGSAEPVSLPTVAVSVAGVEMKIDGGAVQQSNGLPTNSDFVFYTYNETAL